MSFRKHIMKKMNAAGNGRGGTSTHCGPLHHRHPDFFQNKCHPISIKHRRKQYGPKQDGLEKLQEKFKKLKVH